MDHGLFAPFTFKSLHLRNRVVMAPMTMASSPGGALNDGNIEYYENRAKGGVGLIVTEGALIDHPLAGEPHGRIPTLRPDAVPAWRAMVGRAHAAGARVFVQVWHMGPWAQPHAVAAHPRTDDERVGRRLTAADLRDLLGSYERAARSIVSAGFDGLELHAAHGYLLHDLLKAGDAAAADGSPMTGYDAVAEVVRTVRGEVGPAVPIQLRFSQWELDDYDAAYLPTPAALERMLARVCDAGVDMLHASTRRFWMPAFAGSDLTLAGWTRRLTGRPTTMVGNVGLKTADLTGDGPGSLRSVERLLAAGECDLVAVGRPLLGDAGWPTKVRDGRFAEIREHG